MKVVWSKTLHKCFAYEYSVVFSVLIANSYSAYPFFRILDKLTFLWMLGVTKQLFSKDEKYMTRNFYPVDQKKTKYGHIDRLLLYICCGICWSLCFKEMKRHCVAILFRLLETPLLLVLFPTIPFMLMLWPNKSCWSNLCFERVCGTHTVKRMNMSSPCVCESSICLF